MPTPWNKVQISYDYEQHKVGLQRFIERLAQKTFCIVSSQLSNSTDAPLLLLYEIVELAWKLLNLVWKSMLELLIFG